MSEVGFFGMQFLLFCSGRLSFNWAGSDDYFKPINKLFVSKRIVDYSNGSLDHARHIIDSSQVSFFYLYSHWCARSIRLKRIVEALSEQYQVRQREW